LSNKGSFCAAVGMVFTACKGVTARPSKAKAKAGKSHLANARERLTGKAGPKPAKRKTLDVFMMMNDCCDEIGKEAR